MRVLIVEDEIKLAGLIRRGLREEGMAADVAAKGEDAVWMAGATEYDAIVLDLMLPGLDGFQTCRKLRNDGVWSPVLMLIPLSAKEFALLDIFMRRPGQVLDRYLLLEHAWDHDYENRSNVVDVYVRYLREKIDRPFGLESIETVRGAGYRMRADGGRPASMSR
jgi:DNA-binding response OmpR family regulator